MKIFPAIDIKDKKCVRLVKGNFNNKTEYKIKNIIENQSKKNFLIKSEPFRLNIF